METPDRRQLYFDRAVTLTRDYRAIAESPNADLSLHSLAILRDEIARCLGMFSSFYRDGIDGLEIAKQESHLRNVVRTIDGAMSELIDQRGNQAGGK